MRRRDRRIVRSASVAQFSYAAANVTHEGVIKWQPRMVVHNINKKS